MQQGKAAKGKTLSVLILNWKDITNPRAGGGTYYTHRIAKHLVEKGHRVTLICANYPRGKKREIIDGVNILRFGNRYTVYIKAPLKILKEKLGSAYDIVIDEINAIPWLTPLYVKAPKLAFIHQTTNQALFKELNKLLATVIYIVEKITLRMYRRIPLVTVSQSVKEELIKHGLPEGNITIVPPGIDVEKYGYVPEKKEKYPLILYVGRLKKYKGIHHLIRAMRYVVKEKPEAKLSVVGEGDYRAALEKQTQKLGLQNAVIFHGYVSEKEKIELLKKAWVLVVPSVKEGFGIVAIEAAACGTLVIGTDTTGLRDAILHGETGFLVPYGKPKKIAAAICKVINDDKLRERLSRKAKEWGERFDWKTTLDKFEKVILQVSAMGKRGYSS